MCKHLLEESYEESPFPDRTKVSSLASWCETEPKKIRVWFQNKRQRTAPTETEVAAFCVAKDKTNGTSDPWAYSDLATTTLSGNGQKVVLLEGLLAEAVQADVRKLQGRPEDSLAIAETAFL